MRILRLKVDDRMKMLLHGLSREYGFVDPDFGVDLYCLFRLRGDGLPDDDLVNKMADVVSKKLSKPRITVSLLIKKRVAVLSSLKSTFLFRSRMISGYDDPVESVKVILDRFVQLNTLNRQSVCESCDLFEQCDFGQTIGKRSISPKKVMNEELQKKVHDDCPDKPAFDSDALKQAAEMLRNMTNSKAGMNSQVASGVLSAGDAEAVNKMAQQAESDAMSDNFDANPDPDPDKEGVFAHGESKGFNATQTNRHFVNVDDTFVQRLTKSSIELWQIARKILRSIEKEGINYKPSVSPEDKRKNTTIKNSSDVTKIHSHQHAMPDEVFDRKLAEKSLTKRQNLKPEARKQLLFVLHDVSDSMNSILAWNPQISFSCASMSKSIILAFIEKIRADRGIFCYAPFEGSLGRIQRGDDDASIIRIENYVSKSASNGYGTNIQSALVGSMDFIAKQTDELKRAEILLLTDGLSDMDYNIMEKARTKADCTVHTVMINPKSSAADFNSYWMKTYEKQLEALKKISTTFVSLASGEQGVRELIESMADSHKKGKK